MSICAVLPLMLACVSHYGQALVHHLGCVSLLTSSHFIFTLPIAGYLYLCTCSFTRSAWLLLNFVSTSSQFLPDFVTFFVRVVVNYAMTTCHQSNHIPPGLRHHRPHFSAARTSLCCTFYCSMSCQHAYVHTCHPFSWLKALSRFLTLQCNFELGHFLCCQTLLRGSVNWYKIQWFLPL